MNSTSILREDLYLIVQLKGALTLIIQIQIQSTVYPIIGLESTFCRYMNTGSQNLGNRTMLKPLDHNKVDTFHLFKSKYRGHVNRGVA